MSEEQGSKASTVFIAQETESGYARVKAEAVELLKAASNDPSFLGRPREEQQIIRELC